MVRLLVVSCISLLFALLISCSHANTWRTLLPGLEYVDIGNPSLSTWSHIHVFRIDPSRFEFRSLPATQFSQTSASAEQFAQAANALITINGGFFDAHFQPLGLRISEYKKTNPLKPISWWGVFYLQNQIPHIVNMRRFSGEKTIDFAVQSGPRLLINGKIPSLKPGRDERSALGISQGKVILLVTENTFLTTTQLAERMQAAPLNCQQAINLDGGSSSQLHAKINSFSLHVSGLSNISDAIVIKPR